MQWFLSIYFSAKENTHDFTEYLRYESDYQPRVDDPDPGTTEILRYTQALRTILEALPTVGVVPAPSEILPGVYLGTVSHAENIKLLNKMGEFLFSFQSFFLQSGGDVKILSWQPQKMAFFCGLQWN